jgi:uncharacterized protein YeaO (DUF488 family)
LPVPRYDLVERVEIVRVYDAPAAGRRPRVLVDRLWPRGVRKGREVWDRWARDVAPSTELRTWYGHDESRFGEFRRRYANELRREPARSAYEELRSLARTRGIVLATATREVEISAAQVLADRLRRALRRSAR